jgi:hypothetical protein
MQRRKSTVLSHEVEINMDVGVLAVPLTAIEEMLSLGGLGNIKSSS